MKRLFFNYKWKLKSWWPPYIRRAAYDKLVREKSYTDARWAEVTRENQHIASRLDEIVPKLVKLSLRSDSAYSGDRYRLIIDLDPFLIREAFEFGNDKTALKYFSESIGHQVHRELYTMNMQRFNDPVFRGSR